MLSITIHLPSTYYLLWEGKIVLSYPVPFRTQKVVNALKIILKSIDLFWAEFFLSVSKIQVTLLSLLQATSNGVLI